LFCLFFHVSVIHRSTVICSRGCRCLQLSCLYRPFRSCHCIAPRFANFSFACIGCAPKPSGPPFRLFISPNPDLVVLFFACSRGFPFCYENRLFFAKPSLAVSPSVPILLFFSPYPQIHFCHELAVSFVVTVVLRTPGLVIA